MRRAMSTAAILACVLGLAACNGSSDSGSSKTGSNIGSHPVSKTDAGDNTAAPKIGSGKIGSGKVGSGKTGTPLADTDPCTLLKPADVPELKPDADTPDLKPELQPGLYPSCAGHDYAVAIIDHDQDAHEMDFEGSLTQPVPDIAGHHAAKGHMELGTAKSCSVSMDVTADEYVRVGITSPDGDMAQACDIAMRAAVVVASRIPA